MAARVKVSYSDFKDEINAALLRNAARAFVDKKDGLKENEIEYRVAVGKAALAFKEERFDAYANDMSETWRDWVSFLEIEFRKSDNTGKTWNVISELNSGKIANLKTGTTRTEYAYAVHYRLHCEFGYSDFAKDIDEKVFGAAYEIEFHEPVFEETRKPVAPSAPFSHPPYYLYDDIQDELQTTPANGIWLDPHNHYSIPLSGRDAEQATLTQFMDAPEPFLILPLIAPSGAGKTRLISQWMRRYVPSASDTEWDAGFVDSTRQNSRDPQPWCDWEITRPTLIVIDYTFAYDAVVREIADRARRNPTQHKIRLLVIDHIYPKFLKDDHFWGKMFGSPGQLSLLEQTIIRPSLELKPEIAGSKLLRDVIAAAASLGDKDFSADDTTIIETEGHLTRMGKTSGKEIHGDPNAVRHPLFAALMGQAIREAKGETIDFSNWTRRDLITYYFSGENRLPWTVWEDGRGVSVGALVCAATLRRGLPIDRQILRSLAKNADEVIDYAKRVVSSDTRFVIKPFLPDILGEAFLLLFLEFIEHSDDNVYDDFIAILSAATNDKEANEIASNFQETMARLAHNLTNDDQTSSAVEDGWAALCTFLDPERFEPETPLRLSVSYAIAEVTECIATLQARNVVMKDAPLMARFDNLRQQLERQFCISDIEKTCDGPNFIPATMAFFQFFQFFADQDTTSLHEPLRAIVGDLSPFEEKNRPTFGLAATFGRTRVFDALRTILHDNIDTNIENGFSSLMAVCFAGHIESVRRLHGNGEDICAVMRNGMTCLMFASQNGHLEVVQYIIGQAGVNIHQKDEDGCMARDHAENRGHFEVAELLRKALKRDNFRSIK